LSVTGLLVGHYLIDQEFPHFPLPTAEGSDGLFWQVQSTFLSVGFASVAIAAQLFADAPLAIGASRSRVLAHIRAGQFVVVGLMANGVIAAASTWWPSNFATAFIVTPWFVATIVALVVSTRRLINLFGRPSLLDGVVSRTLTREISARLESAADRYRTARAEVEEFFAPDQTRLTSEFRGLIAVRVTVPGGQRVLKAIKVTPLRRALNALSPRVNEASTTTTNEPDDYLPPRIHCDLEFGVRTRSGQSAFRIEAASSIDDQTRARVTRLLQSSLVFESEEAVSAYEESLRDISSLKDAVGTSLRSGAFSTAQRALGLLGSALRGVWITVSDEGQLLSATRSQVEELLRSVGVVEQDVMLSPRIADLFIDATILRCVAAPQVGHDGSADDCLRGLVRMWATMVRSGGSEYAPARSRVLSCITSLAGYVYGSDDMTESNEYGQRAIWGLIEMVKVAIDARQIDEARRAASQLQELFVYRETHTGRAHVRAGQLVLSAWLDYLSATDDERSTSDVVLLARVTAIGDWAEILEARRIADRAEAPFNRWEWWEIHDSNSIHAQTMQMPIFVDRALVRVLAASYCSPPSITDDDTASSYRRFLSILSTEENDLADAEVTLKVALEHEIALWERAEDRLLAAEPISQTRVQKVREAVRDALVANPRLVDFIPRQLHLPVEEGDERIVDDSRPILGMNLRVSRMFLVDRVFKQTYADFVGFGLAIARGFTDGEDRRVTGVLRGLHQTSFPPTTDAIGRAISDLGESAKHHVLVLPYGGLGDHRGWYESSFKKLLARVSVVETAVLENEAFLFDARSTLVSRREPEAKAELEPIDGATIALGVFEDVDREREPHVRIETGEYFVVWPGSAPSVLRFVDATPQDSMLAKS